MFNRRDFISISGAASAGMLLDALDAFSSPIKSFSSMEKKFELTVMATSWGFNGSIDDFCKAAKKEGYNGIEVWWPLDKKVQDDIFTALSAHQLEVGFLCGAGQSDHRQHLDQFKKMVNEASTNTRQKPLYLNCHSGRDHFSMAQNQQFIDHTHEMSEKTGIRICHETHRARILYAAPVAREYMEKNPSLKLTLDISHWCNVHETFLEDQQETVQLALQRAEHVHARIGHPEGPQVNDPRAPEWADAVKAHFAWWDKIVQRKKEKGERLTVLTEFGPPDYMPTLPYTRQAVADQWAINVYMMHTLRKRYLS